MHITKTPWALIQNFKQILKKYQESINSVRKSWLVIINFVNFGISCNSAGFHLAISDVC
ncbi:hypothetical protein X975_22207, partial [Stegodyphus mimosarum]